MKFVVRVMLGLCLLMGCFNLVFVLRKLPPGPSAMNGFAVWSGAVLMVGFLVTMILANVFCFRLPLIRGEKFQAKSLRQALLAFTVAPLAAAVSLVVTLALWALTPAPPNLDALASRGTAFCIGGLSLGIVLAIVFGLCFHRGRGGKIIAGIAAVTALAGLGLIWDEPLRAPAEAPPVVAPEPRAIASDALLRREGMVDRPATTRAVARPRLPTGIAPGETGAWRLFVVSNAEFIRAEWARRTEARAWIAALEAFPVIGDTFDGTAKTRPAGPAMLRATVQLYCAYASLLATEGRGDEALEVVRPMLSVTRKLQPLAQSRARLLWAREVQRACQRTVDFILHSSTVAETSLRALQATLHESYDFAAAWRRAFRLNSALFGSEMVLFNFDDPPAVRTAANLLRPVIAPHATANLVADQFERLLVVAAEGRGEGLRAYELAVQRELLVPSFKNALGRYILATDADQRFGFGFVREGWRVEDERRALLAAVQAKLAKAPNVLD